MLSIFQLTKGVERKLVSVFKILDTLSKITPSTGRCGQFFQLISLLPGNTYQLKELAAMSC